MPLLIFTSRLKKLIDDEKMNPYQLSIATKIPSNSIYEYMNGRCLPIYNNFVRIANFFEVSTDYLLGIADESIRCYYSECEIKDIPKNFASRLKGLLKEKGLKQIDLARMLHKQPLTISEWVNAKSMPETATLIDLAKIFDCTTDYLLCREYK